MILMCIWRGWKGSIITTIMSMKREYTDIIMALKVMSMNMGQEWDTIMSMERRDIAMRMER